jgi:hypothetical protein
LEAGAGSPSSCYNHVNRSFLVGVGLLGRGELVARPFLRAYLLCPLAYLFSAFPETLFFGSGSQGLL